MISGQMLRLCPEGKPASTFPDHTPAPGCVDINLIVGPRAGSGTNFIVAG
jgi:hypothetical protein